MRYRSLGHTGLYVSELCLGTMTFGGADGIWKQIGDLDVAGAAALIAAAREAGVNFIDTANAYAGGRSEEVLGQALRTLAIPREEIVIATKVYNQMTPGPNGMGTSRGHLINAVRASLKRLQTDYIDLYQLHGFDRATPMEETLEALDLLVRHGHVRYIGLSNWAAWQVAKAAGIAEARRLTQIASLQAYYTIAARDLEREIAPMLASEGIGLMVWSPLAGGLLTGKFQQQGSNAQGRRASFNFPPTNPARLQAALAAMRPVAERHGVSLARLAIAWLLHQKPVTSVILGARRPDQLQDTLSAADLRLTAEDLAALDEATRLEPEYPGWMVDRQAERRDVGPPQLKGVIA